MLFGIDHHIGEKLAEKRVATLLAPPLVFWGTGLLVAWLVPGPQQTALNAIVGKSLEVDHGGEMIAAGAVALLALLAISGVIIRRMDLLTLRLCEGYWPTWIGLGRMIARLQNRRIQWKEQRLQQLAKVDVHRLNQRQADEYAALDWYLTWTPVLPARRLPTRLGNVLRAAELKSREKYGLECVVCWPRLWLLLPADVRSQLGEARDSLDSHSSMISCCVLLALGAILLALWGGNINWPMVAISLIALLCAYVAYRFAITPAICYGSLLESAFDLYRHSLYAALRWPQPTNAAEEIKSGEAVTEYLLRGSDSAEVHFSRTCGGTPGGIH